jgi:hypothetical protein
VIALQVVAVRLRPHNVCLLLGILSDTPLVPFLQLRLFLGCFVLLFSPFLQQKLS